MKLLDRILGRAPDAQAFTSYPQTIDTNYVFNIEGPAPSEQALGELITVDNLTPMAYNGQTVQSGYEDSIYDGGKFFGGFGQTQIQQVDYWTLRARSTQLFNENLYARGIVRRLITNEINTGLTPEASPDEQILGLPEDSLNDWTENVETRFALWAQNPELCDYNGEKTFGGIQRAARMESLIAGDVLVVLRNSQKTRLPQVQLIRGDRVQTPFFDQTTVQAGHEIKHGVEFDARGKTVAFWVRQKDGDYKRLPARGGRSGRRLAWLVYGTERRLDDVRGQPLLSIILQSLKEIDRYRDSAQRKALVNSFIATYIKKTEAKPSSLPMSGGAVRKDTASVTDGNGTSRQFNASKYIPGLVMEELQQGEEPVSFGSGGTDLAFAEFEEAIIASVAWANEIPPEILRLAFSNNYSASQAAINEFKIYLNRIWSEVGENFCAPIYNDWLISEVLIQKISAPGLLEAWRTPNRFDEYAAWVSADWYGSIKPSTDMLKQTKGSQLLINLGLSTHAREARVTTGTKFSKNIKRLRRENELLADTRRPILELEREFDLHGETEHNNNTGNMTASTETDEIEALFNEMLEDRGISNAG